MWTFSDAYSINVYYIPSLISWQPMHVGDNQYKNVNGSVATVEHQSAGI